MILGYINKAREILFDPMTPEERKEIYARIRDNSTPSPSFYMMVCISTIIASYGLLANSTAVVIGAMLVAPLMGPIFGIALGLSNGDNKLLKNALISELIGMLVAVGLAAIIGLVPLRPFFDTEIIARTQPTIYDVIIALASGLAGAYSMVNKKLSPALPGVAISTALVPPLATVGLCLSTHNWDWAMGAFLLFLVNLLAIEFAAAAIYALSGLVRFDREKGVNLRTFFRRFNVSLIALVIVAAFMTHTLYNIVAERALQEELRSLLAEQVSKTVGARLSEVRYEKQKDTLQVMAVVLTPREFDSQRIAKIETVLKKQINPNTHLVIRSLLSRDADSNGQVFITEDELIEKARLLEENRIEGSISKLLTEELSKYPGTRLVDISLEKINEDDKYPAKITVVVNTPTPITPSQVAGIEEYLNNSLDMSAQLIISSVITRDADNQRYMYDDSIWQKPLDGPELEFHQKLEFAIIEQLYKQEPAAKLLEFYYSEKDERMLVLMQIRSPHTFDPRDVKKLEKALQTEVDERIQLIVRSQVGADASADYYLQGYDENLAKVLTDS